METPRNCIICKRGKTMNKFKLVKTMLMNAPVSLTMAVVAQVMSVILGHIPALNVGEMILSFIVSYAFACVIGYFIPTDKWGMRFAEACGAEKGSWRFDILVNLVVNTFFCIVMTVFMTWFSLCVRGNAPLRAVPGGFLEMIVPVWICCFFVSLFSQRPAISRAKQICGMA